MRRDLLAEAFGDNPRLIAEFEEQAETVEQTSAAVTSAVEATDAMDEATVLTLSTNTAFKNERVVVAGLGIKFVDDGSHLTVKIEDTVPRIEGGQVASFYVTGPTTLLLPETGTLATAAGAETLSNKTLAAPKLSGLGDYANDAAAAGGGVPVGGVYRNGSALMVRVA